MSKETPESEEQKFISKIKELKRRIEEVEQSNEISMLAINRTKSSIRRSRLEYSILLERLESKAVELPLDANKEISPPPSPIYDLEQKPIKKPKKEKKVIRDPNLPKRPTNAYLIFCESEKERLKTSTSDNSLSSVQELGKILVESWKNLDEEGKKKFHKLYEDDKERFKQEMIEYNKKNGGDVDLEGIDVDEAEIEDGEENTIEENVEEEVEEENDDSMDLDPKSEPPEELVDPDPELDSEIDPEIKQESVGP